MKFLLVVCGILTALKIAGLTTISWWIVFAPVGVPILLAIIAAFFQTLSKALDDFTKNDMY